MSSSYINAQLRRDVISRAASICEYCRTHEDDSFFGCHADNLALVCSF